MRRAVLGLLSLAVVLGVLGCATGEVTQQDQATKVKALQKAATDSQAKDGIKSE